MELAAARQAGFVSKKLVEKGDKHSKKRILAVNGIITMIGRKKKWLVERRIGLLSGKEKDLKGYYKRFIHVNNWITNGWNVENRNKK